MKSKITHALKKGRTVYRDAGFGGFAKRASRYTYHRILKGKKQYTAKDILFIVGCELPHPRRYRVDHQMEQLRAAGYQSDSVFYSDLTLERLKYYRGFVFFRCPSTDVIKTFIEQAKMQNKRCFFDVDDLVIDQKYTDTVAYVQGMGAEDKKLYDDGVNRMRQTLEWCDVAITTTERLNQELGNYVARTYINRNVASDEMVYTSQQAVARVSSLKDPTRLVIGYFSGTITHNEDFELIAPALLRILKSRDDVDIKIVGILDIPAIFAGFEQRFITIPFMDWKKMPGEVALCDVVVAPLVKSIFNEAKSENKWLEASLVKVPVVASNVGAFQVAIEHGVNGFLSESDDWFETLSTVLNDAGLRSRVGNAAYLRVLDCHTTVAKAAAYKDIIAKELAPNIAFMLPTTDISGGVNVILKHAEMLRDDGWDVTLLDAITPHMLKKSLKNYSYQLDVPGFSTLTLCKTELQSHFNTLTATLWTTLDFVKEYPNATHKLYLVQGFETDFTPYGGGDGRFLANATYCDDTSIRYITMSPWCERWLSEKFHKKAARFSNGLDLSNYPWRKREIRSDKKINLLIEGDSQSAMKNTDEAFRIVESLDRSRFHVSYLSYRKEPKSWYRVDTFYNRIPAKDVGKIYSKCDILIKTSLLESFSYPPLEMMATGGFVVAIENDGNREYLRHKENCLTYKEGDIGAGVAAVMQIIENTKLRKTLSSNGLQTAHSYQWRNVQKGILETYNQYRRS